MPFIQVFAEDTANVYVTPGGKLYHESKDCIAIRKFHHNVFTVTRSSAIEHGRSTCRLCIHKEIVKQRKDNNQEVFFSVHNRTFYHEYLDCVDLDTINGYETVPFDSVCNPITGRQKVPFCPKCEAAFNVLQGKNEYKDKREVPLEPQVSNANKILLLIPLLFFFPLILWAIFKYARKSRNKKSVDFQPEIADTRIISLFLQQFAKSDALKYTTHGWDLSSETGKYRYKNYDDFKNQYSQVLKEWEPQVSSKCPLLWQLISGFMMSEDNEKGWSSHDIKVGYNKYMKEWMDTHPGEQPFDFEIPDDKRPTVDTGTLSSFKQVVNVFKSCIQFRDNELYNKVILILKKSNVSYDKNNIKKLKGVTFYTNTESIIDVFRIVIGNIGSHGDTHELEIQYEYQEEEDRIVNYLSFLHPNSFSNGELTNPKISGLDKDGAIASIKEKLRFLGDFAVESRFKVKGKEFPLHINYLVSNSSEEGVYLINEEECTGFKYIFKFYSYKEQ